MGGRVRRPRPVSALSSDEGTGPSLIGAGAFLKGVLRPGSLQDQPGPSIATEFGVLLPGINAEPGFGASFAGHHLPAVGLGNGALQCRHGPHAGASRRCVCQHHHRRSVQVDRATGRRSLLRGGIRDIPDRVRARGGDMASQGRSSFDVGIRHAITNGHPINELKLGMTFGFPLRPLRPSAHN